VPKGFLLLLLILLSSEAIVLQFIALLCAIDDISIPVLLRWAAIAVCLVVDAFILAFLPHGGAAAALAEHRRKHWKD
jgi:hypothetical protein